MVPKLLLDVGWPDLSSARAHHRGDGGAGVVLFGLMPLLSGVGLSQRVDNTYKAVILWGGLRGAVTLALALAVKENRDDPAPTCSDSSRSWRRASCCSRCSCRD